MRRMMLLAATALSLATALSTAMPASAQVIVQQTYPLGTAWYPYHTAGYAATPLVQSYPSAPVVTTPVTSYYSAPLSYTTSYAPTAAAAVAPVATECCATQQASYTASYAPVTTYAPVTSYSPVVTPVRTTYYTPLNGYAAPVTSYYGSGTSYYSPTTSYYAPTTAYYAPATTSYYAPTTAYYNGAVVRPTYEYVPGQPVRNAVRAILPPY